LIETFFRLAVEDGLSFNQIATSEFISLAFGNMGYKARKSHNTVSKDVGDYIKTLKTETQAELKAAFDKELIDCSWSLILDTIISQKITLKVLSLISFILYTLRRISYPDFF
jgi:adenylate kinase